MCKVTRVSCFSLSLSRLLFFCLVPLVFSSSVISRLRKSWFTTLLPIISKKWSHSNETTSVLEIPDCHKKKETSFSNVVRNYFNLSIIRDKIYFLDSFHRLQKIKFIKRCIYFYYSCNRWLYDLRGKKKKTPFRQTCVSLCPVFSSCIYHTHRIVYACVRAYVRTCVRAYVCWYTRTRPTYLRAFASPIEHRECGDYATRVERCNRLLY